MNNVVSNIKKNTPLFLWTSTIFLVALFISLILIYLFNDRFLDHAEGQITSVSWLLQQGNPLYHSLDSPERYSIIYGAMLYIINGLFLKIFTPSLFTAKLANALGLIVSIFVILKAIQKKSNISIACLGLLYTLALLLIYGNIFGTILLQCRSDSLILLCLSLVFWTVFYPPSLKTALVFIVTTGIVINLKITGILYFVPFYTVIYPKIGIKKTILILFASFAFAFIPFLHPNISLIHYWQWLTVIATHGIDWENYYNILLYSLYLIIPLLLLWVYLSLYNQTQFQKAFTENKLYWLSLMTVFIALTLIAAKPGSGYHHLIPLIPVFLYGKLLIFQKINSHKTDHKTAFLKISIVFTLLTFLTIYWQGGVQGTLIFARIKTSHKPIVFDIQSIIKNHPHKTLQMGYGEHEKYPYTYYRPLLVFAGNPYLIDATALMDMGVTDETIATLKSCQTQIWLIPKGNQPFQMINFYTPTIPLFPSAFQQTFLDTHQKRESSEYFDLWFCKKTPTD